MGGRRDVAVELRGVGKTYVDGETGRTLKALEGVDLTIGEGEFVSVIGPSGCGKTTILKIVDGLLSYDEGEVLVNGQLVQTPGRERAMVFQSFALLPWLDVRSNVAFGLMLQGVPRQKWDGITEHYIRMMGLQGFETARPAQLSGGMQQRVGLARALAVDPAILLMDEPFGSLDAQTRNVLQAELERIWSTTGKTTLFVTHAMDEAVYLSDRVVIMAPRPGHIQEILHIDLPRPRTDELRSTAQFAELTGRVWNILRKMIVRRGPTSDDGTPHE
jgi:ABC-type nitrate/sulfonate/bicarbonate transport system ATPase subunit